MSSNDKPGNSQVKLRFDQTSALYSAQFVTNVTQDEVVINFSSGVIADPQSGENVLPIHSRIAMTRDGAKRLLSVLKQTLEAPGVGGASARAAVRSRNGARTTATTAGFPRVVD